MSGEIPTHHVEGKELEQQSRMVSAEALAWHLRPVIEAMGPGLTPWLPGYRVRVLDGNHLTSTERRLDVLRACSAGPLPGQALLVLEPDVMLATHMVPCEEAHAQERSMTPAVLALVEAGDCWVADRNSQLLHLFTTQWDREATDLLRNPAACQ
jgi:hypothetical protein